MVLDVRLAKLARGVTVAEAARAHSRSLSPGEVLNEADRGRAAEFEAILEAMFLVAAVDGEISEQELEQLRASFQAIVDLHVVSGGQVEALLAEFNRLLARDGWHTRLAIDQKSHPNRGRARFCLSFGGRRCLRRRSRGPRGSCGDRRAGGRPRIDRRRIASNPARSSGRPLRAILSSRAPCGPRWTFRGRALGSSSCPRLRERVQSLLSPAEVPARVRRASNGRVGAPGSPWSCSCSASPRTSTTRADRRARFRRSRTPRSGGLPRNRRSKASPSAARPWSESCVKSRRSRASS